MRYVDPGQREENMTIEPFTRIALRVDLPEHGLRRADRR